MKVKEIMKRFVTINEDISLKKAAEIMTRKKRGALVLIKKNKIKGIVTRDDLVKHYGKKVSVSKIMKKNIPTISIEESLSKAKKIMRDNELIVLPVFRENKLVGIIKARDIIGVGGVEEGHFLFK